MSPKAAQIGEALITDAAAVGFLSGVDAQVRFEYIRTCEGLGALSAAVRPLFSVDTFMLLQVDAIEEAVSAERTLVGPFSLLAHMDPFVGVEVPGVRETFPAVIAQEGLLAGVRALMPVTVDFLAKRHGAVGAGVWLLPCVNPLVLLQSTETDEAFLAGRADVGFLVGVHALMFLQVRFVVETHLAVGASEGPLPCVDALMALQVSFGLEAIPTQLTAEWFVSAVRRHVEFKGRERGTSSLTHRTHVRTQR